MMLSVNGRGFDIHTRKGQLQAEKKKTESTTNTLPPIIKHSSCTKGKNGKARTDKINKQMKQELIIKTGEQDGSKRCLVTRTKTVKEIAEDRLAAPANFDHGSNCGSVRIRFNHYNSAFPIHNGVLKWESVDDKYSISFVYRGNYVRNLEYTSDTIPSNQRSSPNDIETRYAARDDMGIYFIDLLNDAQFVLRLEEDPVAGIGAEGLRVYKQRAPPSSNTDGRDGLLNSCTCTLKHTNRAVSLLTSDLKAIKPSELNSAEAKDLLERRDLEDILFS